MQEIGVGHVIHDEMAPLIFNFKEDGPVFNDVLMFEFLDINKIFFQVEEVFLVELDSFDSQRLIGIFFIAFSDDSVGSFA